MLASLVFTTLFASLAAAIHLNLPESISQCDRIGIDAWGEGKINVAVVLDGHECEDESLKEWTNVESATFNYTVTQKPGTQVAFLVEEIGSDKEIWSNPVTIKEGSTDCVDSGAPEDPAEDAPTDGNKVAPPTDNASPPAQNVAQNPNDNTSAASRPVLSLTAAASALFVVAVASLC